MAELFFFLAFATKDVTWETYVISRKNPAVIPKAVKGQSVSAAALFECGN